MQKYFTATNLPKMTARKLQQDFEFAYPLTREVVRSLRLTKEHIGDLLVQGTAYCYTGAPLTEPHERYTADIDFVRWNGTDIKDVLLVTGFLADLEEMAVQHAAKFLFD
jgi:hypothetical protein